jgi:hypothetical protein
MTTPAQSMRRRTCRRLPDHFCHEIATLLLTAAAVAMSLDAARTAVYADTTRLPNIVLIVADDKYVCCLSSSEKPLQIRTFFRFPGFQQTMADCDEFTGIAMN